MGGVACHHHIGNSCVRFDIHIWLDLCSLVIWRVGAGASTRGWSIATRGDFRPYTGSPSSWTLIQKSRRSAERMRDCG